jgi:uncharacterized protein
MPLPATALYATLLAALFLVLSIRVIQARRRYQIALGAPHRLVERAVRAHGNCAEYVPFGLVLLGLLEGMGLPAWGVHALGTTLLAGRVLHAYGISREPEVFRCRVTGTALTLTVFGVAAAALLGLVLADALG